MLRRYLVSSMPAALERIRIELGPDALVLESKWLRRRFLWLKPVLEVLATDDGGSSNVSPSTALHSNPPPPGEVESQSGPLPDGDITPSAVEPLHPLWSALRDQALDEQLTQEILLAAARESEPAVWSSPAQARSAVTAQLERRVITTGAISLEAEQCTVLAVVGPTGVGKTTTIAKLATSAKSAGFRVGLVTIDTYRVAAVEQLRKYGELLEIPVHVAYDPGDLQQTVQALRDLDLILIDTPGCGGNNHTLLQELERFFVPLEPCQIHLAISCGTHLTDMLETARAYGNLPLGGLILTKVDEAVCMGPALSLIHRSGRPVSYLTTGQSIASDVEVATSRRLAELLVPAEVAA